MTLPNRVSIKFTSPNGAYGFYRKLRRALGREGERQVFVERGEQSYLLLLFGDTGRINSFGWGGDFRTDINTARYDFSGPESRDKRFALMDVLNEAIRDQA